MRSFRTLLLAALLLAPHVAFADDPALAPYRERFRQGMERYKAGAVGEAIALWAPIYAEIGGAKAYRLAYNLGVAYEQSGDATHAAEHYEVFLSECAARASRGETDDSIVQKELVEAREHLDRLVATKGRIRVAATTPPVAVQIDNGEPRVAGFVAYVAPGTHAVRTSPGTPAEVIRSIDVLEGQSVDIAPQVPATQAAPDAAPIAPAERRGLKKLPAPVIPTKTESPPPFASEWLYVLGGLTAASAAVPVALNVRTWQLRNQYLLETSASSQSTTGSQFQTYRSLYYGSFALPALLGATTATLIAVYFGARHDQVAVSISPEVHGASGSVSIRF